MELTPTNEQELLLEAARAWVARACPIARVRELDTTGAHDPGLWREIASFDWPSLALPVESGGTGAGILELALVAEALGEGAVPTPLLTSVTLAALPLLWAGDGAHADVVEALARGDLVGTLALIEPGMRDEWMPVGMPGSVLLNGTKVLVPWGHAADVLLVATDGGLRLVERSAPGVRVARHDTLGGDPLAALELDGVRASPIGSGDGRSAVLRALDHAAVVQLAYTVGVAATLLDLSVHHARERQQFGRSIGSFQAVAHRCADMRAEVDACRFLAYQAAWALDHYVDRGANAELEVAAALAYSKDAIRRVARHAHQVHGALGFSTEHDLHLFSRRAKAFELVWGSATRHRERLAGAMGLRGEQ